MLLAAGVLYLISMAPGALWQDNGMAQVRVLRHDYTGDLGLALAHPLFYLISRLFQQLPVGQSAFRTNLVAAVFGALTVANVYLLLRILLIESRPGRWAAAVGTLSLALAHTFWQHAALAEVYTVSTFILTCELLAVVMFVRTARIGWWLLVWFLNGLETANHVLALITLAVIVGWSAGYLIRRRIHWGWIFPAAGLWVLGALPYLYLGFAAWQGGQPPDRVLHSMLFGEFQSQVLNLHLSGRLLATGVQVIVLNFPTPNLLLIPAGVAVGRRLIPKSLFVFLLAATLLHLGFALRYPVRDQYTFFIIPILFLAVWLGLGAAWFLESRSARTAAVLIVLALLAPVVYALIPPAMYRFAPAFAERFAYPPIPYRSAPEFFFHPWKTGYRGADRLAAEVFDLAAPGTLLVADSTASRPFIYHQIANGKRPDIEVVESPYRQDPIPNRIRQLTADLARRQVLVIRPYPGYCPDWILRNFRIEPFGPIYRVAGPK